MCLLSIKVPIQKKSGNLFNDPRIIFFDICTDISIKWHVVFKISCLFSLFSRQFIFYESVSYQF